MSSVIEDNGMFIFLVLVRGWVMAKADWSDSIITVCEDIRIISNEPRVVESDFYVEVYQNASSDREDMPLIKIKCEDADHAGRLHEAMQEVDIETFTSLEDL